VIIYFSGSARNIQEDIDVYRRILGEIRALGHVVARDWVETTWIQHNRKKQRSHSLDWIDWHIVKEAEEAIEAAELVIAEASDTSSFGVGYEVAFALQRKKPTLLLVRKDLAERSYATGIKNDLATYKKYDDKTLEKVVETFIKENTLKTKDLRFNFVIDRHLHNHLRWKSFRSGKTKAEIVRDLLIKDMKS
jgi:hypothetical protein